MVRPLKTAGLVLGIPGLLVRDVGPGFVRENPGLRWALMVAGTAMVLFGLGYYALAKGRDPRWSLLGMFSGLIGSLILASLKDLTAPSRRVVRPAPPPDAGGNPDGRGVRRPLPS